MGHLTRANYRLLHRRMDRSIPGVADSDALYEILRILFSDVEAELCSQMPMSYFSVEDVAKRWGTSVEESQRSLDALASKGLVCRKNVDGQTKFLLVPPVLGFFEFSMMRTDGRFDRKQLAELYHTYVNVEEDFARQAAGVDPPLSRVFVQEDAIVDVDSEVLSYEKASLGIDQATCITTGTCFCRHKMEHLGKACDNPQDVCLTFNAVAEYLAAEGIARRISKQEAHDILDLCVKRGLMQIGDNKGDELVVICNCCGCCCDLLTIYKRFGTTGLISPSNYLASIDPELCSGCRICVDRCPVDAIENGEDTPRVDVTRCLGCGVCSRFCPVEACSMRPREERPHVPNTTLEKVFMQSIDQGKTGHFLFDDPSKWHHRQLSRLINHLVSSPPVQRLVLSTPIRARLLKLLSERPKFATPTIAQGPEENV